MQPVGCGWWHLVIEESTRVVNWFVKLLKGWTLTGRDGQLVKTNPINRLVMSSSLWLSPLYSSNWSCSKRVHNLILLYFDLRPGPKMLFQGDAPEGSDTFQWPVIERDRVGGLRLIIWDKVKVPRCHYSDAPEESDLWTAWQLFPLDDD